jgi:hypothetical protein
MRATGIGHQGRARAGPLGKQIVNFLRRTLEPGRLDILGQHGWRDFDEDHQDRFIVGEGCRLALSCRASQGQDAQEPDKQQHRHGLQTTLGPLRKPMHTAHTMR